MNKYLCTASLLTVLFAGIVNAQEIYDKRELNCKKSGDIVYCATKDGLPVVGIVNSYYDSGNLQYKSNYVNGLLNGIRKEFYESGALKSETNWKDGKQNGVAKFYHENGKLKIETNYINGKQNGPQKEYDESGTLKAEVNFIDDKLNGSAKFYYDNGKLKGETEYKDEVEDGLRKQYYESGALQAEINYKSGKKNGVEKWYYENGKLKGETEYKDGKKNGIGKEYNENGSLASDTIYKDDEFNGICKGYDENGNLKYEANFKDGKIEGPIKEYDENGEVKKSINIRPKNALLESISAWKKSEQNGDNEQQNEEREIKSGLNGNDKPNNISGSETQKVYNRKNLDCDDNQCKTKDGELVTGIVKFYYDSGELAAVSGYKAGKKDGAATSYYPNGNIEGEGNYVAGNKEGMFYFYDEEGIRKKDISYKNDKFDGKFNLYRRDGSIVISSLYKNGLLHGVTELEMGTPVHTSAEYVNGYLEGKYDGPCVFDETLYVNRDRDDLFFRAGDEEYDDGYDGSQYKYNDNWEILHKREYKLKRCVGTFHNGEFTGKMMSDKIKYGLFDKLEISFVKSVPEGEFYGCLDENITKNIRNRQILLYTYDHVNYVCGHGYIVDGQFSGEFDSMGENYKGKAYDRDYFFKGKFVDGKYTGYAVTWDENKSMKTFRTYKNGILDGATFDYQFYVLPYIGFLEHQDCVANFAFMKNGRVADTVEDTYTLEGTCEKENNLILKTFGELGIKGPWFVKATLTTDEVDRIVEYSNGAIVEKQN